MRQPHRPTLHTPPSHPPRPSLAPSCVLAASRTCLARSAVPWLTVGRSAEFCVAPSSGLQIRSRAVHRTLCAAQSSSCLGVAQIDVSNRQDLILDCTWPES